MGTRKRHESSTETAVSASPVVAAFASLGAAAIHAAAAPDHYGEWWAAGVFFYAVAAFQALWALVALRSPGRAVMMLGVFGNVGVLVTWALSRTVGMPVGPTAGVPEEIGQAGLTAVALEAVVCLAALWRIGRQSAPGLATGLRTVLVAGAVAAFVVGVSVPAVQAALTHSHGAEGESASHGHDEDDGHDDPPGEPGDVQAPNDGDDGEEAGEAGDGASGGSGGNADASTEPSADTSANPESSDGHDDEPHAH